MLEARRLFLELAGTTVLRGVDLELGPGESLGVFGPNGAGKTSLLRLITLQRPPSAGEVMLFGRRASVDDPRLRGQIGVLGHTPGLYSAFTGYENLLFYARLYRVSDARRRIDELLRLVGLGRFRHDPVATYSAGMRQRLGLARAVLHDPRLLVLDEPHQSLDAAGSLLVGRMVEQARDQGKGVLFVSHELDRGYDLATRFVIVHRGRIVWRGLRSEVSRAQFREALSAVLEGVQ